MELTADWCVGVLAQLFCQLKLLIYAVICLQNRTFLGRDIKNTKNCAG
ncbi:hypothetical protein PROVRETT_07542 [Providencia rettgeri DSM 1131]|nr:hypothetical protein PROVRETT_07542 [Providencia rettgeri DSM 1131]